MVIVGDNIDSVHVRAGPDTAYGSLGLLLKGQFALVTGKDQYGTWWQIDFSGQYGWVFAGTITLSGDPSSVPTLVDVPLPQTQSDEGHGASACPGGCIKPPPGCTIKGDVNRKGQRIYVTLSSLSYDMTLVRPEEGDRWFCTPDEAEANGFRPFK
jgi:hypothetical protein